MVNKTARTEPMNMEDLLASQEVEPYQLRRGDVVEGTVVSASRDALVLDVGAKSEGLVPASEMQSIPPDQRRAFQIGDTVLAYVLQQDSEDDQMILSIDRARGEQGWRVLQDRFESGDIFDAVISGYNKGGLLANVGGVSAFVPLSQVVGAQPARDDDTGEKSGLADLVGQTLQLKVIEINRRRNRVILSQRAALQEWRAEQKDRLLSELHEGEIRLGTITSIRNFGVFVDLGGADGLVHLSELSWDRDVNPERLFTVGDRVDVYVMKVDQESKKIGLSIRRARPQEWDDVVGKYEVGDVVPAVVTKLVTFGAFARINGPVEGLVHVSELVDRRISHPREVVNEGDVIPVKIVRIERDRHRLGLSLRQARTEAERAGWIFSEAGGVHTLPADVAAQFGVAQTTSSPDSVPAPPQSPAAEAAAEPDLLPEPATAMEAAMQRAGLTEPPLPDAGQG